MSNGLGAGFAGFALVGVLLGLAGFLALILVVVFVARRWTGHSAVVLEYVSVVVLGGVLLVGGFGVLALYDEALSIAVLFGATVLLPLAVVGASLYRRTELPLLDVLATAGLAWSLPFVLGVVVTFGVTLGVGVLFDLAPAESRQLGVRWLAIGLGGSVAVVGTELLGRTLRGSEFSTPGREPAR